MTAINFTVYADIDGDVPTEAEVKAAFLALPGVTEVYEVESEQGIEP